MKFKFVVGLLLLINESLRVMGGPQRLQLYRSLNPCVNKAKLILYFSKWETNYCTSHLTSYFFIYNEPGIKMNSVKERLCYCPVIGSIYSVVFSWLVSVLMIRMQISHFSCSLSAGMQTCYQTQQHLDTGLEVNWEFCGHRSFFFFWEGMRLLAQSYVKVTLCQKEFPDSGQSLAVIPTVSMSEWEWEWEGECYSEVISRSGKMDWTENRCTNKWRL